MRFADAAAITALDARLAKAITELSGRTVEFLLGDGALQVLRRAEPEGAGVADVQFDQMAALALELGETLGQLGVGGVGEEVREGRDALGAEEHGGTVPAGGGRGHVVLVGEAGDAGRGGLADLERHPPSGQCNTHSWSANARWSACCYTRDHAQARCMWDKPREISRGERCDLDVDRGIVPEDMPEDSA